MPIFIARRKRDLVRSKVEERGGDAIFFVTRAVVRTRARITFIRLVTGSPFERSFERSRVSLNTAPFNLVRKLESLAPPFHFPRNGIVGEGETFYGSLFTSRNTFDRVIYQIISSTAKPFLTESIANRESGKIEGISRRYRVNRVFPPPSSPSFEEFRGSAETGRDTVERVAEFPRDRLPNRRGAPFGGQTWEKS